MDITQLFVSQRQLRQPGQVPALVEAILNGYPIPPIRLSEAEDGTIQVDDGHHRVVAYWRSGRTKLERHEYVLILTDRPRPRFGRVADLVQRAKLQPAPEVPLAASTASNSTGRVAGCEAGLRVVAGEVSREARLV